MPEPLPSAEFLEPQVQQPLEFDAVELALLLILLMLLLLEQLLAGLPPLPMPAPPAPAPPPLLLAPLPGFALMRALVAANNPLEFPPSTALPRLALLSLPLLELPPLELLLLLELLELSEPFAGEDRLLDFKSEVDDVRPP